MTAERLVVNRRLGRGNNAQVFLATWRPTARDEGVGSAPSSSSSLQYGDCAKLQREAESREQRRSGSPSAVTTVRPTGENAKYSCGAASNGCSTCCTSLPPVTRGTPPDGLEKDENNDSATSASLNCHYRCSEQCLEGASWLALKVLSARSPHVQREVRCLHYLHDHCRLGVPFASELPCPRVYFACHAAQLPADVFAAVHPALSTPRYKSSKAKEEVVIAMELLGPDLFDFTDEFRLVEEEVCLIALEMLSTLRRVHELGVTHRSVKPENFCWNPAWCEHEPPPPRYTAAGETEASEVWDGTVRAVGALKLIDYGRGSLASHAKGASHETCQRAEMPYTGWWHSLNGFLGRPLGPKDDLLGVVHTVGFLFDDYHITDTDDPPSSVSSLSSHSSATMSLETASVSSHSTTSVTAAAVTSESTANVAQTSPLMTPHPSPPLSPSLAAPSADGKGRRRHRGLSYADYRHQLSDAILDGFGAVRRRQRKRLREEGATTVTAHEAEAAGAGFDGGQPRQRVRTEGDGDEASGGASSVSALLAAEHDKTKMSCSVTGSAAVPVDRYAQRAQRLNTVVEEVLPRLMPDQYYPPSLPGWWKAWLAECNADCLNEACGTEEMTQKMAHTLRRRLRECLPPGEDGVDRVRRRVWRFARTFLQEERSQLLRTNH